MRVVTRRTSQLACALQEAGGLSHAVGLVDDLELILESCTGRVIEVNHPGPERLAVRLDRSGDAWKWGDFAGSSASNESSNE